MDRDRPVMPISRSPFCERRRANVLASTAPPSESGMKSAIIGLVAGTYLFRSGTELKRFRQNQLSSELAYFPTMALYIYIGSYKRDSIWRNMLIKPRDNRLLPFLDGTILKYMCNHFNKTGIQCPAKLFNTSNKLVAQGVQKKKIARFLLNSLMDWKLSPYTVEIDFKLSLLISGNIV
ncbi:hypothetical protein KUTeg_009914 [Tegillarca granosa]|uniref:Uncharacterized protein n=1 Tax=Tegillarca granosa TaxID=220873 RepID=A0ABQ9F7K0_TEGGR|nr:hypothetical protein KUTeg_009914 [Tegillarca granosa]